MFMVAPVSKCEPTMTLRPAMAPLKSLNGGIFAVEQRCRTQTWFTVRKLKWWKKVSEAVRNANRAWQRLSRS